MEEVGGRERGVCLDVPGYVHAFVHVHCFCLGEGIRYSVHSFGRVMVVVVVAREYLGFLLSFGQVECPSPCVDDTNRPKRHASVSFRYSG